MSYKTDLDLWIKNQQTLKVDPTQTSRDWTQGDALRMNLACDEFFRKRNMRVNSGGWKRAKDLRRARENA